MEDFREIKWRWPKSGKTDRLIHKNLFILFSEFSCTVKYCVINECVCYLRVSLSDDDFCC